MLARELIDEQYKTEGKEDLSEFTISLQSALHLMETHEAILRSRIEYDQLPDLGELLRGDGMSIPQLRQIADYMEKHNVLMDFYSREKIIFYPAAPISEQPVEKNS